MWHVRAQRLPSRYNCNIVPSYVRNACSAGFKGNLQDGAYPSRQFLASLNPDFADFAEEKISQRIGQLGERAGGLTKQAAGSQY